jgi:hypothetical protein
MTTTTVVSLKSGQPYDIYIGRGGWWGRKHGYLHESIWANPFKAGEHGTLDEVIALYEARVRSRPDLMAALPELRGKVLGCWCKPKPCHGDVLARLADEAGPYNAP